MSYSLRLISALFVAGPACILGAISFFLFRTEYFWLTYVLVSIVFIGASILIGITFPYNRLGTRTLRTWMWLFMQGILAWVVALLTLTLLNSTPLCVGRNNGDGTNTLFICFLQTIGVAITYTPLEMILLGISSISGSFVINSVRPGTHTITGDAGKSRSTSG